MIYPSTINVRRTNEFGRLEIVSDREAEAVYELREPPSDALRRLVRNMKLLGLWDAERDCPKCCDDPTKWRIEQ